MGSRDPVHNEAKAKAKATASQKENGGGR